MNKNVIEIIDALREHKDNNSIRVLEEIGTNSPDNEVREYTSRALVKKNIHDSLKIVIINKGKGINDMSPSVAMSTINEILALKDKTEVIKILDDKEVSAGIKVRASQTLLDLSLKNREQADIISRIQNLEEMLKSQEQ